MLAPHTLAGDPTSDTRAESNVAHLATVSPTTIWADGAQVEVECWAYTGKR